MAGASNINRLYAYILETTQGTTPATPGFTRLPFATLNMTADPRVSENKNVAHKGQRSSIIRNGIAVSGSAQGPLIYGEYDDFLASLFQADWSSDVLVNGEGTVAMTIENTIPQGEGAAVAYNRYRGVEAVGGSIALAVGEQAQISFDLIGIGSDDAATSAISGATYTDVSSTDALSSHADIGVITMSGLGTLSCLRSLTMDFAIEGKDEQQKLSSNDLCGITRGAMVPTLSGEFYVEDSFVAAYNAARAGTDFALTVPIGSVSGSKYTIEFPSCEFTAANLQTGENGPAFQPVTIMPKYNSGIGGTCRITRAVA